MLWALTVAAAALAYVRWRRAVPAADPEIAVPTSSPPAPSVDALADVPLP
jgi:hypothetical protein